MGCGPGNPGKVLRKKQSVKFFPKQVQLVEDVGGRFAAEFFGFHFDQRGSQIQVPGDNPRGRDQTVVDIDLQRIDVTRR